MKFDYPYMIYPIPYEILMPYDHFTYDLSRNVVLVDAKDLVQSFLTPK